MAGGCQTSGTQVSASEYNTDNSYLINVFLPRVNSSLSLTNFVKAGI